MFIVVVPEFKRLFDKIAVDKILFFYEYFEFVVCHFKIIVLISHKSLAIFCHFERGTSETSQSLIDTDFACYVGEMTALILSNIQSPSFYVGNTTNLEPNILHNKLRTHKVHIPDVPLLFAAQILLG